jgi:signal transduction histidine kinase
MAMEALMKLRLIVSASAVAAALLVPCVGSTAGEYGTADEAKALVEKAASFIKENGADKAFPVFNDKKGPFVDRDLYVFVRSMDGNTVAHGANTGMIGHTSLELKDADGKLYNKEMIELAKAKGSGWVDYRWVNPVSKKIEQKSSFIERVGDYVVGAGFYKQ